MSKQSEALLKLRVLGAPIDRQTPAQRVQLIERINQVAREEHLRKARLQRTFWLSSAAAIFVVFSGLAMWSVRPTSEPIPQRATAMDTHLAHQASARVWPTQQASPQTASAKSRKTSLASGTQLRAAAGARYEVKLSQREGQSDESILLESGLLQLKVPALGRETVSVKTPDALVLVHGTEFSVHVTTHDGQTHTKVEVTEGLVSVQSGDSHEYLRPGASWTSDRVSAAGNVQNPQRAPIARRPEPLSAEPTYVDESTDAGTLALENAIYARAMKFKLAGDFPAARAALDELIKKYPRSPLVPSAEKAKAKFRRLEGQSKE